MSGGEAAIEKLIKATGSCFAQQFHRQASVAVLAPGRINLIGEHTDYNDGHVLPIAIDRFTAAAGAERNDDSFSVYTADLEEAVSFQLERIPAERPDWAAYAIGTIAELAAAGHRVPGTDIAIKTTLPIGAGLSSSAALEVSIVTLLERMYDLTLSDADVVTICRAADHNYVGINSGPMDQFAARASHAGHCGLLDCRSLEMTHYPLPAGIAYLSVYSGIPRQLAGSEYNQRQSACQQAVAALIRQGGTPAALRDVSMDELAEIHGQVDSQTFRMAHHVVSEQQRVFDFVAAAEKKDTEAMGRLLHEGHFSLSDDYLVSMPEIDAMIRWLYEQSGVIGARITGAGFGGSLVCLVHEGTADIEALSAAFSEEFGDQVPEQPQIRRFASEDGARRQHDLLPKN